MVSSPNVYNYLYLQLPLFAISCIAHIPEHGAQQKCPSRFLKSTRAECAYFFYWQHRSRQGAGTQLKA